MTDQATIEAADAAADAYLDRNEIRQLIDENARLRALILDMGSVIRRMDEAGEHSEFWTQDDAYLIDGRWA